MRPLVLTIGGVALAFFSLGLPAYYTQFATLNNISPTYREIARANLGQLGLSTAFYAWFYISMTLLFAAVCLGVVVLIFRYRSRDAFGLYMMLTLALFAITFASPVDKQSIFRTYLQSVIHAIGLSLFVLFFFIFPNGSFVPQWSLWPWFCTAAYLIGTSLFPNSRLHPEQFSTAQFVTFVLLWGLMGLLAQIYRYRHVSTCAERRQTRWVVFGSTLAILGMATVISVQILRPDLEPGTLAEFSATFVYTLAMLCLPLSIGFAILRHHLFDIDVIIRKTLIYAVLSIVLALIFYGSVALMQSIVSSFTGQQSAVATVVSTLAIAALFSPLRRRIQTLIDRRFYRRKYDTQLVLSAFARTISDEISLDALGCEMERVIEETMQPANLSLWLRDPNLPTKEIVNALR